jgi:thioredoxin 1
MPIDAPVHTSEGNLPRVLGTGLPVLLVFWRRDCPPCDQLAPILDKLARSYAGRALVVKVNAAEEAGLLGRYRISRLPSIVSIKEGQDVATAVGAVGERELARWMDSLVTGSAHPPLPEGPSIPLQAGSGGYTAQATRPSGAYGEPQSTTTGQAQPVTLTDSNFDQVLRSSSVPVMVDFWAVWCGPCKMIAPVVEQLAREYAGRAVLAKLNVDENPGVAGRYGIMSIPTLMIFRNGQVVDRIVGAQPGHILRERLAKQVS